MANTSKRDRKAAEKVIFEGLALIDKSGNSRKLYEEMFGNMTDAQFDVYMEAIRAEKDYISVVMENLAPIDITVENNLAVAEHFGVDFHQRLIMTDPATGATYLSKEKFFIYHLPVRRQIQTLENKISLAEDNKHIDDMTGQPTGVSKGSSMSNPEALVIMAQGLTSSLQELMSVRGGNTKAFLEMNRQLIETGSVSLGALERLGTRATSADTLSRFFTAMHFDNTI